jgi:sugar lactone lactonase YvrE
MKKVRQCYLLFLWVFVSVLLRSQNVYTYAGTGTAGFSGDGGSALFAQIDTPVGIAIDGSGNIYFCDFGNYRIRKITPSGLITTIAGGGTSTVDGVPATTAKLGPLRSITLDGSGNIYFTELGPHRVRRINTSGILNTIAGGNNIGAFSGDGGPAISAQFNNPSGIAVDASGNIYVADYSNNRIRMINSVGTVTTIAGIGTNGFSGDGGPAISAQLSSPIGIVLGTSGNIIFTDYYNYRVREINSSGIINTIAGTGTLGYSGDGGPATMANIGRPSGITRDVVGNIYFTDDWYSMIKKINTSAIINTLGGAAGIGYAGDGGPAALAKFHGTYGIVIDNVNNIYVTDGLNNRIREVCVSSCALEIGESNISNNINIYPNPTSSILNIFSEQNKFANSQIEITNYLGQAVLKTEFKNQIDVSTFPNGFYFLNIQSNEGVLTKKIVIQH